jgi:hypothetical protein
MLAFGSASSYLAVPEFPSPNPAAYMTPREAGTYPASEIEGLIAALTGVRGARVTLNDTGRIHEVHILAEARTHPKQIVRNVESALSAGLGLSVDRRFISVAQVKDAAGDEADDDAPTAGSAAPALQASPQHDEPVLQQPPVQQQAPAQQAQQAQQAQPGRETATTEAVASRYVFVGYDARTQPDVESACRVTIRHENEVYSGSGSGPSTPLGRAQSAAHAVFSAIATAQDSQSLGLEGVTLVESHGRTYVLVAAHAIIGRSTVALTGTAALHRSPEEAAILASLQATNRWNELNG